NPTSLEIDGSGNVYVIGSFSQSVDFDPGPDSYYLDYPNGYALFLLKLDTDGNFEWVKGILGYDTDQIWGKSITIDNSGNICIAGYFDAVAADFDPEPGVLHEFLLSSVAFYGDAFIAKYDASGIFLWAKQLKGSGGNISDTYGIKTDQAGNVYTTGYYMATVDFNPGPPAFFMSSKLGTYDIYVLKLDAAGNFVWAKSLSGNANEKGLSMALDAAGNVYTTGYFSGWVDFNPSPAPADTLWLQAQGDNDIFISKLDASGNSVWAKSMGGSGDDEGLYIGTDQTNNVYITGYYYGTVDFDPNVSSTYLLTSAGGSDVFVAKLDAAGNFVWANSKGGINNDASTSINIDLSGNVITTGGFTGTVDFDESAATYNLISNGSPDVFITKIGYPSAIAVYAVTGGGSYCQGTEGLPVGLANSEVGVTYTLFKDGVAQMPTLVGTGSAISFGIQLAGTYTISGTLGGNTTGMTGNAVITETPSVVASVTVAVDANNVCAGTLVTFSASPVGGGTAPTYLWFKNSVAVANDSTYDYVALNGDVVYVVMTTNALCASGSPATSNRVTMAVTEQLATSVAITASSNPVIAGTTVTFTPAPVNGGAPTYQWYINGSSAGTGSTYSYVPVNSDQVYVVMTTSLNCVNSATATSNTITVTVLTGINEPVNAGLNIFSYDKTIVVENANLLAGTIGIYTMTGCEIYAQELTSQLRTNILVQAVRGTYIVKVLTAKGLAIAKVVLH
ncbi:MAG: hypothetical protein ACOYMF_18780, partial [Bacteroidales bacterium]